MSCSRDRVDARARDVNMPRPDIQRLKHTHPARTVRVLTATRRRGERANQECRRRHLKEDGKSGIPLMDGYDTRNPNLNKCWQFLFVWKQQGTKSDLMSDSETTDTAKDITWISWSIFGVWKRICVKVCYSFPEKSF